ncbi:MAG TPA: PhaM family polyhydroxyalkanoate granule multifunctional regulatory protein [Aquabacterium sp.]|uniref:PhaM family polyhydroxyalkanoate granule multifunctional regulatory protein n=1 Tax=Aquabacterium sp. TaxID=1872578 RepID=UPI002E36774D|nr:PhaM family polyhydroxyalkanoate granule multifunctional regulatory protein [Aquabacterium sp.]HEX5356672.1 PhaM family polyhydroxyalkanoate granule multifunctional regulatory protein [Aquabacterium sp.]
MPTRPPSPDPTGATQADQGSNPFASMGAGLGAGLGFFQDWLKAAGSALPNMPGAASAGSSGMPAWSMPTLDPEELEKRIQDLKTVQFWLEQNARMIAMTIQGLEVQRMTLSTLKGMNVSMDALRESLKVRPDATPPSPPPPAAAPAPAAARRDESAGGSDDAPSGKPGAASGEGSPEGADLINPMRWWDTLTQQFTHLASQAAQTVGDSVGESMDMIKQAQATAAEFTAPASSKKAKAATGTRSGAATKRATGKTARKTARSTTPKP